jgi:hypothetical protein
LRNPVFVRFLPHPAGFQVESPSLRAVPGLHGEGATEEAALRRLAGHLHGLVEHHRKPPHLQSEADRRIDHLLQELIDWDQFQDLNPVEQPLWGQVRERREDGSLAVHWFLGPRDVRDRSGLLASADVPARLRAFKVGEWFYGSAKAYPESIHWTRRPVKVPDPHDRRAARQAWDRLPRTILADMDTWPERTPE